MGKVKDGTTAPKALKPSKGGSSDGGARRLVQFLANLAKTDFYKPMQGRYARIYTAIGLGVIFVVGIYRLFETLNDIRTLPRFGICAGVGLALGWLVFRLLHYPPFVEFLISTEAEMKKVSWTSRDDLHRATTVVLTTVALMSVFLFGVDWLWSLLLQLLGVLKFGGDGAFGSSAG